MAEPSGPSSDGAVGGSGGTPLSPGIEDGKTVFRKYLPNVSSPPYVYAVVCSLTTACGGFHQGRSYSNRIGTNDESICVIHLTME